MNENNYSPYLSSEIKTAQIALELLKRNALISKTYGSFSSLYFLMTDGNILVINKYQKYYISKEQFITDFNLSSFYVYKNLSEIEIDQEFHNLRQ